MRPGYPPPRQRPRSRGLSGCLTALVVGVVLLVLLLAALAWMFGPTARGADGPVQDGRLQFSLTDASCPKAARDAKVRACRVTFTVKNVGVDARVLYPSQQKLLDDDGGLHDGVKLLDKQGKEITPFRVEPGASFTGALVFSLPKGVTPAEVELHDSALSRGVRSDLP